MDLHEEGQDLSVSHVEDQAEADRLTVLWAPTCTNNPQTVAYLLLPDDCFETHGLTPVPVPDVRLHPFLSERHFQVSGIDEGKAHLIAEALLQAWGGAAPVRSVAKHKIREEAKSLAKDEEFMSRIKPKWREEIWPSA